MREGNYAGMRYAGMVQSLIRKRYTLEEELAVQRQREEKPEEFAQYFAYCETCKQKAREYTGKMEEENDG